MSQTPVSAILARLSYELHALADATDDFHHLAFADDSAAAARLGDADYIRATQSIDHTQQILANLSEFTACLAMASPSELTLNPAQALQLITLGDLRRRLADTPEAEFERADAGEADFF